MFTSSTKASLNSAPRGFTLIEALVVVAIIGILLATALPTISGAAQNARRAHCANNQSQLIRAWLLYAQESGDRLPTNSDGSLGHGYPPNWVAGSMTRAGEFQNTRALVDRRLSLLATYIETPEVYKCPSDESSKVRSVSMNCRMGPNRPDGAIRWIGGLGAQFRTYWTWTDIRAPSQRFVLVDESADTINDAFFAVDMSNTGSPDGNGAQARYWLIDVPATYHRAASNFAFSDGHVEHHSWDKIHLLSMTPNNRLYVGDLSDVKWLQDHTTGSK